VGVALGDHPAFGLQKGVFHRHVVLAEEGAAGAAGAAVEALWRSLNRWSLPVSVRGSAATNSTTRGYLNGAMVFFTWSCSVLTIAASPVWPGLSTQMASTTMPRSSSGTPITP